MSIHAFLLCIMLRRIFQTYSSVIVVNSYTHMRKCFSWQDSKGRWVPHALLFLLFTRFCDEKMSSYIYTAISIKVVPRAKRKSRIRARKAAGNRYIINE
jgi:hypothetical protein